MAQAAEPRGDAKEDAPLAENKLAAGDVRVDDNGVLVFSPKLRKSMDNHWVRFWADVFIFAIMHYNLYPMVAALLFWYMMQHGYTWLAVTLVLLYVPTFFSGVEKTGEGRQWDGLRHSHIWMTFLCRWRLIVYREQPLDGAKQYVFGYHPHGLVIMSRVVTYANVFESLFPGVDCRALGASTIFHVPFARDLCLWLGAVDAGRATARKVLEAGKSVTVYPGGIREMYTVNPKSKTNVLVLKSRFGFIKLAMRSGADLVPVMVFNEKHMYHRWIPSPRLEAFLKRVLPVPAVFFWGRFFWVPLDLPKGKPFGVVYGKPIPVTKNENPTDEEVQALHATYVSEVERLFREYKGKFNYDDDEKLEIR